MYGSSYVNVGHRQSSDKRQSDKMTEALRDLANEVNLVDDDDNDDNVEVVDDEATMFEELFEDLEYELWARCKQI